MVLPHNLKFFYILSKEKMTLWLEYTKSAAVSQDEWRVERKAGALVGAPVFHRTP
jgi:hypothetical protein